MRNRDWTTAGFTVLPGATVFAAWAEGEWMRALVTCGACGHTERRTIPKDYVGASHCCEKCRTWGTL